jgi:hypothetical protein
VQGGTGVTEGDAGYPACATASPLHSVFAEWSAPTQDSPAAYRLLRTFGAGLKPNSVVVQVPAASADPLAATRVDSEELPDGQRFTYYAQAMFAGGDKSGLSIPATVWAQNDAPVAQDDEYDAGDLVGGFVVGNLFDNDTDPDLGPSAKLAWTAVDADGDPLQVPGLSFTGAGGEFEYDRSYGSVTFDYRVDAGTWTDGVNAVPMSDLSNLATVTIKLDYDVTVDPLKTKARLGSAVPAEFLVELAGAIVRDLGVVKRIESVRNGPAPCAGPSSIGVTSVLYSNPPATGDTGGSDLRILEDGSFRLNWNTTSGTPGGKGCYTVLITLDDGASANPRMTPNAVELN